MIDEVARYILGGLGLAAITLLWRIDRRTAYQNGSLARVVKEFEEHKENDREDFQRVHDKLDDVRGEQARVARELAAVR